MYPKNYELDKNPQVELRGNTVFINLVLRYLFNFLNPVYYISLQNIQLTINEYEKIAQNFMKK